MSTIALIIPAAGSGSRLKRDTPKPFIPLAGKSILERTVGRFIHQVGLVRVVVATSSAYRERVQAILDSVVPEEIATLVVEGGEERQHSIHHALQEVGDVDLVMVHDAVRPFVTPEMVAACCKAAEAADGAMLAVPAKDTIKRIGPDRVVRDTPSRRYLWQAQTPQVFKKRVLVEAYEKALGDRFVGTDDSSLVERLGFTVKVVKGDHMNFKITYPLDLELAELLVKEEQQDE